MAHVNHNRLPKINVNSAWATASSFIRTAELTDEKTEVSRPTETWLTVVHLGHEGGDLAFNQL